VKNKKAAACVPLAIMLIARAGTALAAQQLQPTDRFLVRNPSPGRDPTQREILFVQEVRQSSNAIVGDPTAGGATLQVSLADGGEQCFDLPAFGWSPEGTLGFRYRNRGGSGAAVSAHIKKEPFSGDFILKWKLRGTKGPINVVPQPGTPSFAVDFKIVDGDEYCAGGSTPPDSTTTAAVYNVRHLPAPATCGVPACDPTTSLRERAGGSF
jgi:hypothetical protein